MTRGKFISIEGGEGAGKSTQVLRLCETLGRNGIDVIATREPGGTPAAERIRSLLLDGPPEAWDPVAEALLHFAARCEHIANKVLPALETNRWVVSDRFADSTVAYQGYGHGLGAEVIAGIHRAAVGGFGPDLTLILDQPVAVGLARIERRARTKDRYEGMDTAFHQRVRDGYLCIARREPDRCVVVDAEASADAVAGAVWTAVVDRLLLPEHSS